MKYCLYCVFSLNFVYLCSLILLSLCKKLSLKVHVTKFVLFGFFNIIEINHLKELTKDLKLHAYIFRTLEILIEISLHAL